MTAHSPRASRLDLPGERQSSAARHANAAAVDVVIALRPAHRNAPLTPEGRKRLIERCRTRPIAHVVAKMGISRATASK